MFWFAHCAKGYRMRATLKQTMLATLEGDRVTSVFEVISGGQTIGVININANRYTARLNVECRILGRTFLLNDDERYSPIIDKQRLRPVCIFENGQKAGEACSTEKRFSFWSLKTYKRCLLDGYTYEIYYNQIDRKDLSSVYTGGMQVAEFEHIHTGINEPHIYEIVYTGDGSLLASVFTALHQYLVFYLKPNRTDLRLRSYYKHVCKPEWLEKYDPQWSARNA